MSGPSWLALVAVVWWAALVNPAGSQSFATGMLDGNDLPAVVASADRHLSLQTSERRRSDGARDGNLPAAIASAFAVEFAVEPVQRVVAHNDRPVTKPARSPAQPRAPPAA